MEITLRLYFNQGSLGPWTVLGSSRTIGFAHVAKLAKYLVALKTVVPFVTDFSGGSILLTLDQDATGFMLDTCAVEV